MGVRVVSAGGMYCYDPRSCNRRWIRAKGLMSSTQWPDIRHGKTKITHPFFRTSKKIVTFFSLFIIETIIWNIQLLNHFILRHFVLNPKKSMNNYINPSISKFFARFYFFLGITSLRALIWFKPLVQHSYWRLIKWRRVLVRDIIYLTMPENSPRFVLSGWKWK